MNLPTSGAEPSRRTDEVILAEWRSTPIDAVADVKAVERDLTFDNPAVIKARQMGLPVAPETTVRFEHFAYDGDRLLTPRHYVPRTTRPLPVHRQIVPLLAPGRFAATSTPRNATQREAVDWLGRPEDGRLMLNAGKGKTFCALAAAAKVGLHPILVVVHEQATMGQWVDRITEHTDIRRDQVGTIQGSTYDVADGAYDTKPIIVAMMHTLALGEDRDPRRWLDLKLRMLGGLVIFDELDVFPAEKMARVLSMFDAVRWGLTATKRPDGLQPILEAHVGRRELYRSEYELNPKLVLCRIPVPQYTTRYNSLTNLLTNLEVSCRPYLRGLRALCEKAQAKGRKTALLMQRTEGIEQMAAELREGGHDADVIHGGVKKAKRLEVLRTRQMIVANRKIMGRALDAPALDSIIMTPTSNPSLIEQCAGRCLRVKEGKQDPVVVLVVPYHPSGGVALNMIRGMGFSSLKALRALGFSDSTEVTLNIDQS